MEFKDWLRKNRRAKLLTQQELADAIEVDRVTINYLENGHWLPTIPTAIKLAKFFEVDTKEVAKMLK